MQKSQDKSLIIKDASLKDISDLIQMKQLEYLTLSNVDLMDIEVIGELENLEYLDISNNQIENISCLSKLSKLKKIDLSSNYIQDISPLIHCPLEGQISLGKNPIKQIPKGIFNWNWDCITPVFCSRAFQHSKPIVVDFNSLVHPMPKSGIDITRNEMGHFMAIHQTYFPDDK